MRSATTRLFLRACLCLCVPAFATEPASAQALAPLSGKVSSERDGVMEGVIVSARRAGSTITVSVVSDATGAYSFPAGRLEPGPYDLTIRAAGYELAGPGKVDLAQGASGTLDLKLKPAARAPSQITNAEWIASAPGDFEIKRLLLNCTDCHSVQRIFEIATQSGGFPEGARPHGGLLPRCLGSAAATPRRRAPAAGGAGRDGAEVCRLSREHQSVRQR